MFTSFPFSSLFSLCDLSTSFYFSLISLFCLFTPVWKQSQLSETSENTESLLTVCSFTLSLLTLLSAAPTLPQHHLPYTHAPTHTHIRSMWHLIYGICSWQGYINKVRGSLPQTIKNTHTHTHTRTFSLIILLFMTVCLLCLKTDERIHLLSCWVRCYQVCHLHTQRYKKA